MQKYIDSTNTNLALLNIIFLIIVSFVLLLSIFITKQFNYNLVTTISSLVISIPLQLIYIFVFCLEGNPSDNFESFKHIKKVIINLFFK